ncbi:MAG: response regulator [Myxococcota bacterium]
MIRSGPDPTLKRPWRLLSAASTVLLVGLPGVLVLLTGDSPRISFAVLVVATACCAGILRSIGRTQAHAVQDPLVQTPAEAHKQTTVLADTEHALARANFLAIMNHEIRTPMNGIIGIGELLTEDVCGEEGASMVQMLQACSTTLLRVIDDMFEYSQLEAGKLQLNPQPFDVFRLSEELADSFAPQSHAKGVELICAIQDALPERMIGDPERLRQVLSHLLSNAVKFTRAGEITLDIQVQHSAASQAQLRFAVSDTGIGIAADQLDQIFHSYRQADPAIPRKFGGAGLGLRISSRLVALMGSTLCVESTPGEGSTFSFTISAQVARVPPQPDRSILQGMRVLYVGRSERGRSHMRALLQRLGATVQLEENAMAGLQRALLADGSAQHLDLIIVDRHLAGIDGLQLARMLWSQPETAAIPVLMTAPQNDQPTPEALSAAGVRGLLTRPLLKRRLCQSLADLIGCALPEGAAAPIPAAVASGGQKRLLLADDNEINQAIIRRQVQKLGYDVHVVAHGRAAVERFFQHRYDAVLMDCQMPEMSGYEAAAEIRRREPANQRVPIIALTADVLSGVRERCIDAGMDDYLSKPVRIAMLEKTLNDWCVVQERVA